MLKDLRLPDGARMVHIGPDKTGTTAIQMAMFEARESMAEHGVYYPGKFYRRRYASEELFAAGRRGQLDEPLRKWDALAREVAAAGPMRACVSDERFSKAKPRVAAKIVRDLGGDDVHIVAAARRLESYLPSQYQERAKAGRSESYDEWLRIILGDDDSHYEKRHAWHPHDTKALVERWLELVSPDRFTLIVANESDRSQLTTIFSAMLGLPADLLNPQPSRSNHSLAFAEVEMLRVASQTLQSKGVPVSEYQSWLKPAIGAVRDYTGDRPGPRKPPMPKWAVPLVEEASNARIEAVKALPVRMLGDPEWLRAKATESAEVDPSDLYISAELAGAAVGSVIEAALKAAARAAAPAAEEPRAQRRSRRWLRS
jgi:hypothetical protein